MEIKLSVEELKEILREKFNTEGRVNFIFRTEHRGAGYTDGVQHYQEYQVLDSVEIEVKPKNE